MIWCHATSTSKEPRVSQHVTEKHSCIFFHHKLCDKTFFARKKINQCSVLVDSPMMDLKYIALAFAGTATTKYLHIWLQYISWPQLMSVSIESTTNRISHDQTIKSTKLPLRAMTTTTAQYSPCIENFLEFRTYLISEIIQIAHMFIHILLYTDPT